MAGNVIELTDVAKQYKKTGFALRGINCALPERSIVGLVGENGSGKTTLISLILNQLQRDSGTIKILGQDNILNDLAIKQRLGVSIDECCYHPCFTPKNIHTIMRSIYPTWHKEHFFSYLKRFGVDASRKIEDMSKGMKSKLVLAVALAHDTDLLIFDELTSGLDPVIRDDILIALRQYVNDEGGSVLFSTHITSDLDKVADYVLFIHAGKQILFESIHDLQKNYLLLEFDPHTAPNIPSQHIVAQSTNGRVTQCILRSRAHPAVGAITARPPTLEEIMMVYIRGQKEC